MHHPCEACLRVALLVLPFSVPLHAQTPPKVVQRSPDHLACDVDAEATTVLTVTFDQPMNQGGFSFCGGGPAFPKLLGRPVWKNARTIVVEIELEPDHDYSLSLNCPAASNFISAKGVRLSPTPWSFTTLPEELPDPRRQRQRNKESLDALTEMLAERYSYYDLRVRSWRRLIAEHKAALLRAPTDIAWASLAARMLAPTEDIHLHLRFGDRTFPTGTRAVDPLFRIGLLSKYVESQQAGKQALYGRTEDDIGYLLVGAWNESLDMDAIERALAELRGCDAVIVDARPNSGGNELLARQVAAWFVEGTVVYAKNRYRTGKGRNGFGPVLDRTLTGNEDAERRYRGPIAVLTSRYVMSSNESFVMMLQQAQDCIVVGQPTYGSSGNPKPFELPNGVTAVVPTWQDLDREGECIEGVGIPPDVLVEVSDDDLEHRDPILEKALELLRKKLQ